jgi:hypothetical protein
LKQAWSFQAKAQKMITDGNEQSQVRIKRGKEQPFCSSGLS